jgi:hypothetical protein
VETELIHYDILNLASLLIFFRMTGVADMNASQPWHIEVTVDVHGM